MNSGLTFNQHKGLTKMGPRFNVSSARPKKPGIEPTNEEFGKSSVMLLNYFPSTKLVNKYFTKGNNLI